LTLYYEAFGSNVDGIEFATHKDGTLPQGFAVWNIEPWKLPENLEYWIEQRATPWIVNVDLDYFFCNFYDKADDDAYERMFADSYIKLVFEAVCRKRSQGSIAVTTIALSPETCGGWQASETALRVALSTLGVDFSLPN